MMNPFMFPQQNNNLMAQFQNFMRQYQGANPQYVVQQLLNSGKMTQDQFNQLRMLANQLTGRRF